MRLLTMVCTLGMLASLVPVASASGTAPVVSNNKNDQDYTRWSSTVKSYLYENEDGGLTRAEYVDGKIVVEDYNDAFQLHSSRTIPMELSTWGGFYAGEDYNFLIFGQENPGEDDQREVIRVVKYSKDWKRLGQASLRGANTTTPFDAGSLRCDEYGDYLYIRTCHEMYTSSDGLNHQANLMMAVRQSDLSITDSYYNVFNSSYGYVSHSFNQFLMVDQDGYLVALDHGDAYPRGVVHTRYYNKASTGKFSGQTYGKWCSSGSIRDFAGQTGDNTTGASVGGLTETSKYYIMAYNYDGAGGYGDRYPFYHFMDKATGRSWSVQLSHTPGVTTPMLVSTGTDSGYMLWNGKTGSTVNDTLYYVSYGADGKPGDIRTAKASLSDCQPIFYHGKAVWYVTSGSGPVFYTLDASGVTAVSPAGGTQQAPEQMTPPSKPVDPDRPGTSVPPRNPFTDVPAGSYYHDAVLWAVENGITTGVTATRFQPTATCTRGQVVTFLWRAMGKPEPKTRVNPFTDVYPSSPFYKAILWAYEEGITTGQTKTTFVPGGTCTSAHVVTFLWRASGKPSASGHSALASRYPGAYYTSAVAWADTNGLLSNVGAAFVPGQNSPRANIVTYLYRYLGEDMSTSPGGSTSPQKPQEQQPQQPEEQKPQTPQQPQEQKPLEPEEQKPLKPEEQKPQQPQEQTPQKPQSSGEALYRPNPECGTYLGVNAEGVHEFEIEILDDGKTQPTPLMPDHYYVRAESSNTNRVGIRAQYFYGRVPGTADVLYYVSETSTGSYELKAIVHVTVVSQQTGSSELFLPNPECGTYLGKNADGAYEFEITIPADGNNQPSPLIHGPFYTRHEISNPEVLGSHAQYFYGKAPGESDIRYYGSETYDGDYKLVAVVHVTVVA